MELATLFSLAGIQPPPAMLPLAIDVVNVCQDSRVVQPGDLFVAVPGLVTDGHLHVAAAVAAGAVAVVVERSDLAVDGVPCAVVPSSRAALADLAAAFHGFPARKLHMTGVTGTDGKTTSTFLLSHVLEGLGRKTGLLGTVAFKIADCWERNPVRQSTPEALVLQAALAAMVSAGVTDVVLEATSHGLVLDRVRRCAFDEALVTNVTSEHLDFHGTRAAYLEAKALLLAALADLDGKQGPRFAAINADDPGSSALIPRSPVPVITFGVETAATVRACDVRADAEGASFALLVEDTLYDARIPMTGLFNVYNCLGVLAVLHGRGIAMDEALPHLESFNGVPGRMRRVDQGQPFTVIVDFAHTADALKKVLLSLRPLTRGRLIAVFGSAGQRDREKRPVMGEVAARYADYSIITADDPRSESPVAIIDSIAAGARATGAVEHQHYERVPDRREAIALAVSCARPGDVVLLAGKGHEPYFLVGESSVPWNEEDVARSTLRAHGYGGAS